MRIRTALTSALAAMIVAGSMIGATLAIAQEKPAADPAARSHLRAAIGQMLVIGFRGTTTNSKSFQRVVAQAQAGEISGVIWFGRNVTDRGAITAMNRELRRAAGDSFLVAIDQEGGRIERLTAAVGFPEIPSARTIARGDDRQALARYTELGSKLHDWGFNLNLGPVVDLDSNPSNPIIGRLGRSYSADPATVTRYAIAFVSGHRDAGVLTALKHFPGHGSSTNDSHKGAVDVSRTWNDKELAPYRDMNDLGYADIVMTAHVINRGLSGDSRPATLSKAVLTDVLRNKIGFRGVIMTDDLQMGALDRYGDSSQRAIAAVRAGADLLVFANDRTYEPEIAAKVTASLLDAASGDAALAARILDAAKRINAMKARLPAGGLDTVETRSIRPVVSGPLMTPALMASMQRDVRLAVE
jgi:beta-N-acetylhexosaminidase